jgi:hypothetical protein
MVRNFDLFSAPDLPHLPKWGRFDMDGSSWTSVGLWAPGFWRFLSRDRLGLFGEFRAGPRYSLFLICMVLDDFIRVGVLSGPQHCLDQGPGAWASNARTAASAGWYQVHLLRLVADVPLGIRGSLVVEPPPPLPPRSYESLPTHSGQCGSPQAGPGYEVIMKDAITSFQLVRPATPVHKQVNYDYYYDDPSPRCKYRFVPNPHRGSVRRTRERA